MTEIKLGMTARDKIKAPFIAAGKDFEFRTTPVSIAGQLRGDVTAGANGVDFLVFAPQTVKLARKGIGDEAAYGRTNSDATEAETNLQRGGSTDGARDMAIEGIQISSLGCLVNYTDGGAVSGWGTAPTQEAVVRALAGQAAIVDPFGLIVPPQLQSPYLLEDALFVSLMRLSAVELKLDTSRPFNLGCARLFPGSAGASMLHSNGDPMVSNTFVFPEGILWQRDGKADSDLSLTLTLHREVVVPLNSVTLPGGAAVTPLKNVYQRIGIDLTGVSVSELAVN